MHYAIKMLETEKVHRNKARDKHYKIFLFLFITMSQHYDSPSQIQSSKSGVVTKGSQSSSDWPHMFLVKIDIILSQ